MLATTSQGFPPSHMKKKKFLNFFGGGVVGFSKFNDNLIMF